MEIRVHRPEPLKGSLLLVGFPSRGLVGGVAANYVIEELKMWHFASLYDERLPPTVVVREGVAHSPVQFFASAERCGPDGECDKLVICLSEVPLPDDLFGDAAWAIVKWAKKAGVKHIVVLEGMESIKTPGEGEEAKKKRFSPIRGVRSMTSKHDLTKYKVEPLDEGVISSYSSKFLLAANDEAVDLVALYVEARADQPDAHGASVLLNSVDEMLPHINLDAKVLDKRATQLEKSMKKTIQKNQEQLQTMRRFGVMMYQ